MVLQLDQTIRGKPCIVLPPHKYRKDRIFSNGDISWRCLGQSCLASVRTDCDTSRVISHKNDHTGIHPVTMRSVSPKTPLLSTKMPISKSPLVSELINFKQYSNTDTQTDETFLSDKAELITQIQILTNNQRCLVDKIQSLTLELEEERKKNLNQEKKPPIANSSRECQTDFQSTGQINCKHCEILKEETKNMIETIRVMELQLHNNLMNSPQHAGCFEYNLPVTNKFALLGSDTIGSSTTSHGKNSKKKLKHKQDSNDNKETEQKKAENINILKSCQLKRNLYLFTDSQGRGMASTIDCEDISSCAFVYSGAPAREVVKSAQLHPHLQETELSDEHVFMALLAGSNDFHTSADLLKNGWEKNVCSEFKRLADKTKNKNTTLILCSVLKRYDVPRNSVENKAISEANKRMREIAHDYSHVYFVNLDKLPRTCFTRHGFHLSRYGKRSVVRKIIEACKKMSCQPFGIRNQCTSSTRSCEDVTEELRGYGLQPGTSRTNATDSSAINLSAPAQISEFLARPNVTCLDDFPPLPSLCVTPSKSQGEDSFLSPPSQDNLNKKN